MKQFELTTNKYLDRNINGYYHCDYLGFQKKGNPDYINRLKNMSKTYSELDLIEDFIEVYDNALSDISKISNGKRFTICVVPRSKSENFYTANQRFFKKAISCVADNLKMENGTDAIKRISDTKTTHSWRANNNNGAMPYKNITADTRKIDSYFIKNKNIILVDDVYNNGINIAEDCIQTLFNLGAESVILYVIAKVKQ